MDKKNRIRKNSDFQRLYKFGKNTWNKNLILYSMKNDLDETRVGFTISKKMGNAVLRNKTKRRMKEAYKKNFPHIKKGYDLVFIPKKHIGEIAFHELVDSIGHIVRISGLLKRDENHE